MTKTAGELAAAVGAELHGDRDIEVKGVASPERAGARDVIYIEAAKHAGRAATSAAACVIAGEDTAVPGKAVLRHAQPKVAFAKAAAILGVPAAPLDTISAGPRTPCLSPVGPKKPRTAALLD